MKWVLSLLFCWSASAQLPVMAFKPAISIPRWYPTNATSAKLVYWFDLIPFSGAYSNSVGAPGIAQDNTPVAIWTNFAAGFNGILASQLSADQTVHPTNFVSGGGVNGTSPRISFLSTGTSERMITGAWAGTGGSGFTNIATFIIVFNYNDTTGTEWVISTTAAAPWIQMNAQKLEYNQGTTTISSSPAILNNGQYYILGMFFEGNSSTHIDTNGVLMVSGSGGTATFGGPTLGQGGGSKQFAGNFIRIWIWEGILGSTDYANAIQQCKVDFGIH